VEDGGIRCPFHGWLYDVEGRCLEQPAEPEPFAARIHHLAYPCEELGELIFAYLGPREKMPLLPRYEALVREDGTRKAESYRIQSNYVQNVEGALDTVHAPYLHMDHWSEAKKKLAELPKPRIEFVETDFGIWQKSNLFPGKTRFFTGVMYGHFVMPAGFVRIQEDPRQHGLVQKFHSWYVPMDDASTMRFQVAFTPSGETSKEYRWPRKSFVQPGPANDYFRSYETTDTISGIPVDAPGMQTKGFVAQDSMVNETQGEIVDRAGEHFGVHDRLLTAMRVMMLLGIQDTRQGRDPKHMVRDPAKNKIIFIRRSERDDEELISDFSSVGRAELFP
jgi:hypothetical protein